MRDDMIDSRGVCSAHPTVWMCAEMLRLESAPSSRRVDICVAGEFVVFGPSLSSLSRCLFNPGSFLRLMFLAVNARPLDEVHAAWLFAHVEFHNYLLARDT